MSLPLLILETILCCALAGGVHAASRKREWVTPRRLGRKRALPPPTSEGGLAFLLSFLLCLTVSFFFLKDDLLLSVPEMRSRHFGLALSLLWVWGAGKWGDSRGYPRTYTVLVVMMGAAIMAGFGFTVQTIRVGERVFDLGGLAIPATLIWFVAVSEFFRLFDGLDGLLVTLTACAIGLQLAILSEEEGYARALCLATLPPLFGLLPWRVYPARMELRGIGAFLPGFVFGAITLVGRQKAFTTQAVILPSLVLFAVVSLFCLWLLEQHLFLPKKKD